MSKTHLHRPRLAAKRPEGGPSTADTSRHVLDVKHEQTLVVLCLALETNALAADVKAISTVQLRLVINTKDSIAVLVANVVLVLSSLAINISSKSARYHGNSEAAILHEAISLLHSNEVKVVKEGGPRIGIRRSILGSRSDREKSGSANPKKGRQRGHCD